jgi:hypothetical protein
MPIYIWDGKVLFREAFGSKIAIDPACCCEEGGPCVCPNECLDEIKIAIPNICEECNDPFSPSGQDCTNNMYGIFYTSYCIFYEQDGSHYWIQSTHVSLTCEDDIWSVNVTTEFQENSPGRPYWWWWCYQKNKNPIRCDAEGLPLAGDIELVPDEAADCDTQLTATPTGKQPCLPDVVTIIRNPLP